MPTEVIPVRGRVYMADLGHGEKPWLVVSNNARNRSLDSCLAVRITTTISALGLPSMIDLDRTDGGLVGQVRCDDMEQLYRDDLRRDVGALSPPTMMRIAQALRHVLAI